MTTHDCLLLVSELLMTANTENHLSRAIKGARVTSESFDRGGDYPDEFLVGMYPCPEELTITWYSPEGRQTFHLTAQKDH